MALRNSTKGSIDLLHTKKQNEIIFQSVAKNAEKSAFFCFFAVNFTLKVAYIFVFLLFPSNSFA